MGYCLSHDPVLSKIWVRWLILGRFCFLIDDYQCYWGDRLEMHLRVFVYFISWWTSLALWICKILAPLNFSASGLNVKFRSLSFTLALSVVGDWDLNLYYFQSEQSSSLNFRVDSFNSLIIYKGSSRSHFRNSSLYILFIHLNLSTLSFAFLLL